MTSRRDALKGMLLSVPMLGSMALGEGSVSGCLPMTPTPSPPEMCQSYDPDWWKAELAEIVKYRRRWERMFPDRSRMIPAGISIPFKTLPISVYMRHNGEQEKIPAPKIPITMENVRNYGGQYIIDMMINELYPRFAPPGELVEILAKEVKHKGQTHVVWPGRIVSPRCVCDVEELDERRLANVIWGIAEGIAAEMTSMQDAAVMRFKQDVGGQPMLHQQYKKLKAAVKFEAYMWECFGWTTAAGIVFPA